jgi:hypothetical protein
MLSRWGSYVKALVWSGISSKAAVPTKKSDFLPLFPTEDFHLMTSKLNVLPVQSLDRHATERAFVAELDVIRYFGLGLNNSLHLGEGWAAPEENQNWNDGFEASFEVVLPAEPDTACLVTLDVVPNLMSGIERQDVTFYFNGLRLGFWRIEEPDQCSITVEVEPEFWLKRHGGVLGKCTFHLPNSVRPCDISNSQDQRRLGLCFQAMRITQRVAG